MRNSVVLPDPLGPTSPTFSPAFNWNEASTKSNCLPYCLLMFEKEIILKEQLAVLCLFQCSVDRKLPANGRILDYWRVCAIRAELFHKFPKWGLPHPARAFCGRVGLPRALQS